MDLTFNPKINIAETAPLLLGGVEFRVATLVFRQAAIIGEKLPDVLEILNRRVSALANHPNAAAFAIAVAAGTPLPEISAEEINSFLRAASISEADCMLLIRVVHVGLTRAYPRLALDDLLDLPILSGDLVSAANVIVEASKLTERKVPASGEAVAASR